MFTSQSSFILGNDIIVDLLIGSNADVNARDTTGLTPLIYASFHGNFES